VTSNIFKVLSVEMLQQSSPPGLADKSTIGSTINDKQYKN